MMTQERYDYLKNSIGVQDRDSIHNAIKKHTVGIAVVNKDYDSDKGGSGTLIQYNGDCYIITALHVLMDSNNVLCDEDSIFIVYRDEANAKIDTYDTRVTIKGISDEDDLCILELSSAIKVDINKYKMFYNIDCIDNHNYTTNNDDVYNDIVMMSGYPGGLSDTRRHTLNDGCYKEIAAGTCTYTTVVVEHDIKYIYAVYEYSIGGKIQKAPHPEGFSGGGLWLTGIVLEEMRKISDIKLLGVIQCYGNNRIGCIKMHYIMHLLRWRIALG